MVDAAGFGIASLGNLGCGSQKLHLLAIQRRELRVQLILNDQLQPPPSSLSRSKIPSYTVAMERTYVLLHHHASRRD